MAIPLWYSYRTITDGRSQRIDWSLLRTDDQRRQDELDEAKRKSEAQANARAEALRLKAESEREKAEAEAAAAKTEAEKAKEEAKKAALERVGAERVKECTDAASGAEFSYQAYLGERVRYKNFTDPLLKEPVRTVRHMSADSFEEAFERLYNPLLPENLVAERHNEAQRAARQCSALASGDTYSDLHTVIHAVGTQRAVFDKWREQLSTSRSNIQLLIKYASDDFPETLGGQMERRRAVQVIFR